MNRTSPIPARALRCALALGILAHSRQAPGEEASSKLRICATIPDLGDLAGEVGGAEVEVTVFAKGPQDPHFLEAKPSFVKELSRADAIVLVGLDLEAAWAPALWRNARNAAVLPDAPGYIDASKAIRPLDVPAGVVDRALGDVHAMGNPHYLADPINGLRVARLLRDRFQALRPKRKEYFAGRFDDFAKRLGAAMVGERLAKKYDVEKLCMLAEASELDAFLQKQGDGAVEGWLGRLKAARGARVVSDHNIWPYLAARFGFQVIGFLEPKPGVPPTTRHLTALIDRMKQERAQAVLAVPYFDARHSKLVCERTGAKLVPLAHQCGALAGTEHYLELVEHNVKALEAVLGGEK